MKYGMVSVLIPEEYKETFRKNAKNTMQDAANALQWNLYRGICANLGKDIPLFNILPCGSYPQYYKRPFISRFSFAAQGQNLPFCNVKLIRNYFKTAALEKTLKKWCSSDGEPKTLFVYTISQPLLAAVNKIKQKYPELHVCAIVADLPDMSNLSAKQGIFLKIFSAQRAKGSYSLLSTVDSFVLLTKYMADYMNITQPYYVMEGIAPEKSAVMAPNDISNEKKEKIILYTGTLHRKFGALHLLETFRRISDPNVRLVICGIGDSENEFRRAAEEDARIDFRGQLSREEVLAFQKRATVLVNPRLNNETFTKYSFPSKTMEYLASGVPVVAYKLDGIPDEYDEYITYPADDSVEALADTIKNVCLMSEEQAKTSAETASRFVFEKKNNIVQAKKILDFVSSVFSDKRSAPIKTEQGGKKQSE